MRVTASRNGSSTRFHTPWSGWSTEQQTVLPGKRETHFILRQYRFLNLHFKKIIQRREGFGCSGDKSRAILDRLLQYYLTGKEVVFNSGERYTFGHPTTVFTTHREIVEFFEGLYSLYYGNPELYLKALKNALEIVSI